MQRNKLTGFLDAVVPWMRVTVLLIGAVLLVIGFNVHGDLSGWRMLPILGSIYAITWATPFPLSPHWLTRPLMVCHQYDLAARILRWQISACSKLFPPLSWYVTEPELDAIKLRLAYCLRKQQKIAEADALYQEAQIPNYRQWWSESPGSTDMGLEPEIYRYHKLIGDEQECTAKGLGTEAIALSLLIVALTGNLLLSSLLSVALSSDIPTATRALSVFNPDSGAWLLQFRASYPLAHGEPAKAKAIANEILQSYGDKLDANSRAREDLIAIVGEASVQLGDYKSALESCEPLEKALLEKGKTNRYSGVGYKLKNLMQQARVLRDTADGKVEAAQAYYKEKTGKRGYAAYVPASVYAQLAHSLDALHETKLASQYRVLEQNSLVKQGKKAFDSPIDFAIGGFLILLWLLPPLTARKKPWSKGTDYSSSKSTGYSGFGN